ncbi:MAG: IS200/IS605 family transposase [Euryarchaeota archaeon]|nr:IS200/IS605 family transposase [Euryarchaeota archaeon]
MELQSNNHSFGEANFHIVFCPKYRHKIFENEEVNKACEMFLKEAAERHGIRVRALKVIKDHVHGFITTKPSQSVSWAVHKLKGYSAYKLFREFPWLRIEHFRRGHFWSDGYFYRSVGSTTDKAVEFYIKLSQDEENRKKYYSQVGKEEIELVKNPSKGSYATKQLPPLFF